MHKSMQLFSEGYSYFSDNTEQKEDKDYNSARLLYIIWK